jgi:hypothetical protein
MVAQPGIFEYRLDGFIQVRWLFLSQDFSGSCGVHIISNLVVE